MAQKRGHRSDQLTKFCELGGALQLLNLPTTINMHAASVRTLKQMSAASLHPGMQNNQCIHVLCKREMACCVRNFIFCAVQCSSQAGQEL